ncbi:DUF815 domain-containing protein [Croceicoccus sp. F390]|uniref:DUF815 domain-containing protein n=1 Tax=Croceicoccus esteveae TaxID=3075597 RepID=A0ABU2ZI12_9SPHN|nr:DUF815 domain-containing protein [Croceicoccus sp. F390]MDT0576230.1 DUF815 domain-containing protein [Croceicoccus sp. F390]
MNEARSDPLQRIADALDRLAPEQATAPDLYAGPAFLWKGDQFKAVAELQALPAHLLRGIDRQRDTMVENVARHARGDAAHDMLLWGARGMGKSALVRTATALAAQSHDVALVQLAGDALQTLDTLLEHLGRTERRFILFIDDLGFDAGKDQQMRALRSLLDGGIAARPDNVRLAVTTNRRAIVNRVSADQNDPINAADMVSDALALADRFGLSLGFHNCDQATYLAIVAAYASHYDLLWSQADALEWAQRRGARSGRVARHFITEIAGRAGIRLN